MHKFNDHDATLEIYTVQRPSVTACKTAPPIIMDPTSGFHLHPHQTDDYNRLSQMQALGYTVTNGPDFLLPSQITCSDPQRQASPALIYYCLIGRAEHFVRAKPDDAVYDPDLRSSFTVLNYIPSPDDLVWKPYKICLGLQRFSAHFMALDPDTSKLLTLDCVIPKLAFHLSFLIANPKANTHESYDCYWCPTDHSFSARAPFTALCELYLNVNPLPGVSSRISRYEVRPGILHPDPIQSTRIYGNQITFET